MPAALLLPYPVSNLLLDAALLLLYLGTEATRIFFGESWGRGFLTALPHSPCCCPIPGVLGGMGQPPPR